MAVDAELEMASNREIWLTEQLENFIDGIRTNNRAMVLNEGVEKKGEMMFGGGGGGYQW